VVVGRVVSLLVHAHDERAVSTGGRSRDEDLLSAGVDVLLGEVGLGEEAGRLDDDVDTQLAPGKVGRVPLGERLDLLAVDRDAVVIEADVGIQDAAHGVVLQQVRKRLVVSEVVDRDDLEVCSLRESCAEVVASDTAEAVDTDLYRHSGLLFLVRLCALSVENSWTTASRRADVRRDARLDYDSTSRPFVCLRATSRRCATFSQLAMFHTALT
jgi:hypothetical protein